MCQRVNTGDSYTYSFYFGYLYAVGLLNGSRVLPSSEITQTEVITLHDYDVKCGMIIGLQVGLPICLALKRVHAWVGIKH